MMFALPFLRKGWVHPFNTYKEKTSLPFGKDIVKHFDASEIGGFEVGDRRVKGCTGIKLCGIFCSPQ